MKSVDVKSSTYTDFDKKNSKEGPKFKVIDNIRILKYEITFVKDYVPNWSEEVKDTVPWKYVISDVNHEEIARTFYEKDLQKNKLERV